MFIVLADVKHEVCQTAFENLFFRVKKEDFAERYCISETTKEVVICLFKQRLTIKQTADKLKISADNVDIHWSRALRYFRNPIRSKQLDRCFEEVCDTVNGSR